MSRTVPAQPVEELESGGVQKVKAQFGGIREDFPGGGLCSQWALMDE